MSSMKGKPSFNNIKFFNGWMFAAAFLVVIIIACSIFIWSKYNRVPGVEILFKADENSIGQIYISGAVNNPGLYPLHYGDSIDEVLKSAGGLTGSAETGRLELTIGETGEVNMPQKVDVNHAEAWLLAALPSIGETRAQAIVAYRREKGPFRDINELLKVPGIGSVIFESIKNLIIVGE
jgi:competence protein ComEA